MPLRRLRAPLLVLLASLAPLGLAPAAHAALGTRVCGETGSLRCGTLDVPVDRGGAVLGGIGLAYALQPAGTAPAAEAVVPLAGGPGQAALPFTMNFAESLKPLLSGRDLVVFDQRGTGSSGPLGCFGEAGPSSSAQVRSCASALGGSRNFYRSIDSAEDIEALRVAGGYSKIVLYGVSYGTRVALTYAAQHPDRVAALVLDSVVPIEGPDVWARPSFAAVPRVLRTLCADGACRLATPNPNGDLRALVTRLQRRPLSGSVTGPDGSRVSLRLTALGLWQTMLAGDLNPALRAELPGAMRAALRGDRTPILRLRARAAGLNGSVPASGMAALQASGDLNTSLFTATRCSETAIPWNPASSSSARAEQAAAALDGLPASAFSPFDQSVPLSQSIVDLCAAWPDSPLPSVVLGAVPAVPTLVLDGAADLRTPVEQATRVASAIPGARVVTVPNTGHSVIGSDLSGCADDEIAAFAAGTAPTCKPDPTPISPTPRPPLRLALLAGGTRALRTVSAVRATLNDVRRQLIGDAIAAGRSVSTGARTGGLRGGVARVNGDVVELQRVSYVPGVRVSGVYALKRGATSQLQVTGPKAARGRLEIDGSGTARGILGGRRVESAVAARAAHAAGSGWDHGLALPPFAHPALRDAG